MDETFKLKPIRESAIPEALEKAQHYRLLNEPAQAESICRDILRIQPKSQQALVTIILTLTDQFSNPDRTAGPRTAREYAARLEDAYKQQYYLGLICERQGRALLNRGMAGAFAYDGLREAMDYFERAHDLSPEGNDDAILRWNSCVRTIRARRLKPRPADEDFLLE